LSSRVSPQPLLQGKSVMFVGNLVDVPLVLKFVLKFVFGVVLTVWPVNVLHVCRQGLVLKFVLKFVL
jgi:hypothetical protein